VGGRPREPVRPTPRLLVVALTIVRRRSVRAGVLLAAAAVAFLAELFVWQVVAVRVGSALAYPANFAMFLLGSTLLHAAGWLLAILAMIELCRAAPASSPGEGLDRAGPR